VIELFAFACGLREVPEGCNALSFGPVTAVVGPAGGDSRDDVVRHGLVVQQLVEESDAVLPARFGERFSDEAALATAVAPRLRELEERLAAVDGCVELAVRVSRSQQDGERPADGASYMRARLHGVSTVSKLHAVLAEHARATIVAQSPLLHDASYLVERDEVDDFARRVAAYGAAHPELNLVCTGPWAPASFAGVAA
jgi:gas vesicle protein GvpL/GvpF